MGHWFPCFVIIAIEQKTCVKLLSTTMYHFQPVELKYRLDLRLPRALLLGSQLLADLKKRLIKEV